MCSFVLNLNFLLKQHFKVIYLIHYNCCVNATRIQASVKEINSLKFSPSFPMTKEKTFNVRCLECMDNHITPHLTDCFIFATNFVFNTTVLTSLEFSDFSSLIDRDLKTLEGKTIIEKKINNKPTLTVFLCTLPLWAVSRIIPGRRAAV